MKTTLSVLIAFLLAASGTVAGEAPEKTETGFFESQAPAFSIATPGAVVRQQSWSEVTNPRKFIYELVVEAGDTSVWMHYWSLKDKDGTWWLEEVMGFIFQPETRVEMDVSAAGYEVYFVEIPAGPGAEEELNALIVTPQGAFRLTCPGCRGRGGLSGFRLMADTLDVLETR